MPEMGSEEVRRHWSVSDLQHHSLQVEHGSKPTNSHTTIIVDGGANEMGVKNGFNVKCFECLGKYWINQTSRCCYCLRLVF